MKNVLYMSCDTLNDENIDWNGDVGMDRYVFIKKLGTGSYASVWMAYDIKTKKMYAIKIHNTKDYKHGKFELNIYEQLNKLKVQGILRCVNNFVIKDGPNPHFCLVLPLMQQCVFDISDRALHPELTFCIIKQLLQTVKQIHAAGMIHGDLKPENILIEGSDPEVTKMLKDLTKIQNLNKIIKHVEKYRDPEEDLSDVADSTSSHITLYSSKSDVITPQKNTSKTLPKEPKIFLCDLGSVATCPKKKYVNTIHFAAPEALLGLECDNKIDMWAIGCLIHELLNGRALINPYDVTEMRTRYHLTKIVQIGGFFPLDMIKKSSKRDVHFKHDGSVKQIFDTPSTLERVKNENKIHTQLISLADKLLRTDPTQRLTADEAYQVLT